MIGGDYVVSYTALGFPVRLGSSDKLLRGQAMNNQKGNQCLPFIKTSMEKSHFLPMIRGVWQIIF